MNKKKEVKSECCEPYGMCHHCGTGGAIYGLGFIGAVIYFISVATSFWTGVLGFLKALIWPVFLVHGLLKLIAL